MTQKKQTPNLDEYKTATGNRIPKSKVKGRQEKFPNKHSKKYMEDRLALV